MIDLDKVDNAKALLKKWCDDGMESMSTPIRYGQLLDLMNKLSASEKDAARYRWLRDEAIEHQDSGPLIIFSDAYGEPCSFGDCGSIISHDDADKAIDEAMKCK